MCKQEWMDKIDEMNQKELLEVRKEITDFKLRAYLEATLALKNSAETPDLWPVFRTKIAEKTVKKSPAVFRLKWLLATTLAVFMAVAGLWVLRENKTKILSEQDFVLTTHTDIVGSGDTQGKTEESAMDYYYAIATQ